jgi:hypothetical protein
VSAEWRSKSKSTRAAHRNVTANPAFHSDNNNSITVIVIVTTVTVLGVRYRCPGRVVDFGRDYLPHVSFEK